MIVLPSENSAFEWAIPWFKGEALTKGRLCAFHKHECLLIWKLSAVGSTVALQNESVSLIWHVHKAALTAVIIYLIIVTASSCHWGCKIIKAGDFAKTKRKFFPLHQQGNSDLQNNKLGRNNFQMCISPISYFYTSAFKKGILMLTGFFSTKHHVSIMAERDWG